MATWAQLGEEQARAAQVLHDAELCRASVSRAYYGAYSFVTEELVRARVSMSSGRRNPRHSELPRLVKGTIAFKTSKARIDATTAVRQLRTYRVQADYEPGTTVNCQTSREALKRLAELRRALGVLS